MWRNREEKESWVPKHSSSIAVSLRQKDQGFPDYLYEVQGSNSSVFREYPYELYHNTDGTWTITNLIDMEVRFRTMKDLNENGGWRTCRDQLQSGKLEWRKFTPQSPEGKYTPFHLNYEHYKTDIPIGRHEKISRMLTYALRHKGIDRFGLHIDRAGYCDIDQILESSSIRNYLNLHTPMIYPEIELVVMDCRKNRFQLGVMDYNATATGIRCTQGHSIKKVDEERLCEPLPVESLGYGYHGTTEEGWKGIRFSHYISTMKRNHVHFCPKLPATNNTGTISGFSNKATIALHVDLKECAQHGAKIFRSANDVLLTNGWNGQIPLGFIKRATTYPSNTTIWPDLSPQAKPTSPPLGTRTNKQSFKEVLQGPKVTDAPQKMDKGTFVKTFKLQQEEINALYNVNKPDDFISDFLTRANDGKSPFEQMKKGNQQDSVKSTKAFQFLLKKGPPPPASIKGAPNYTNSSIGKGPSAKSSDSKNISPNNNNYNKQHNRNNQNNYTGYPNNGFNANNNNRNDQYNNNIQ